MPVKWNHQNYVGPEEKYYTFGPRVFLEILAATGIQPSHKVLDVGCGSLRVGKLLIPYLNAGNYTGIEPNSEMLMAGLTYELSTPMINDKAPVFGASPEFIPPHAGHFDLVIAIQVFIHCGPQQFVDFLTKMRELSSMVYVTLKIDEENPGTTDWPNPANIRYPAASHQQTVYDWGLLRGILSETGWKVHRKSPFRNISCSLLLTKK